jgi:hypothetical protein
MSLYNTHVIPIKQTTFMAQKFPMSKDGHSTYSKLAPSLWENTNNSAAGNPYMESLRDPQTNSLQKLQTSQFRASPFQTFESSKKVDSGRLIGEKLRQSLKPIPEKLSPPPRNSQELAQYEISNIRVLGPGQKILRGSTTQLDVNGDQFGMGQKKLKGGSRDLAGAKVRKMQTSVNKSK